jgi:hypothetical protein
MVTDSVCGARHTKNPAMSSTECARECVRHGAKYILVDGENTYALKGDYAKLTQYVGVRANVTGSLDGNVMRVGSIATPR